MISSIHFIWNLHQIRMPDKTIMWLSSIAGLFDLRDSDPKPAQCGWGLASYSAKQSVLTKAGLTTTVRTASSRNGLRLHNVTKRQGYAAGDAMLAQYHDACSAVLGRSAELPCLLEEGCNAPASVVKQR